MSSIDEHSATTESDDASPAPWTALFLPAAFLAHLSEEWFGGFLSWVPEALGYQISVARFLVINATGFAVFTAGAILSVRSKRFAWMAVSIAALLGLNGLLHVLATIAFGVYSPGAITGLVIYVPLTLTMLRSLAASVRGALFTRAILAGIALHFLVTIAALS